MAARVGLWGNHGYEADYRFVWTDSDGQPLEGANRYELRLESPRRWRPGSSAGIVPGSLSCWSRVESHRNTSI